MIEPIEPEYLAATIAVVRAELKRLGSSAFEFSDGENGVGIADIRDDGSLITIALTDGTQKAFKKPAPVSHLPPTGIATTQIDKRGHLIVTLTNGIVQDLGRVRGRDGDHGADGVGIQAINMEDGRLVIRKTDGTVFRSIRIVGEDGKSIKGDKGGTGPRGYSFHVTDRMPAENLGQNGDAALSLIDGSIYKKRGGLWKVERRNALTPPKRSGGGLSEQRVLKLIKESTPMQFDDYSASEDLKITGSGSAQPVTFSQPVQFIQISTTGNDGENGFFELDGDTAGQDAGQLVFSNQANYFPTPKERAAYSIWLPVGMTAYITGYIR